MFGDDALEGYALGLALTAPGQAYAEAQAERAEAQAQANLARATNAYIASLEKVVDEWVAEGKRLNEELVIRTGAGAHHYLNAEARKGVIEEMIRRGAINAADAQQLETALRAKAERDNPVDAENVRNGRAARDRRAKLQS